MDQYESATAANSQSTAGAGAESTDDGRPEWMKNLPPEGRAYLDGLADSLANRLDASDKLVEASTPDPGDEYPLADSKDQILGIVDEVIETLSIPEWRLRVNVKGLTGRERDQYEQSLTRGKGQNTTINMENARAKLASMCIVDRHGRRLFSQTDISELGKKSAVALERVFDRARKLSGLTNEDMDELAGN